MLVLGGLIIRRENQPIPKESQSQASVGGLAHHAISLQEEGLVNRDGYLGASHTISNGRTKLAQPSVLDILFL